MNTLPNAATTSSGPRPPAIPVAETDSPAAQAGLKKYDVIVSAGNKALTNPQDLIEAVIDPADAAKQLVDRLDALTPETTGTFWHANGQVLPW